MTAMRQARVQQIAPEWACEAIPQQEGPRGVYSFAADWVVDCGSSCGMVRVRDYQLIGWLTAAAAVDGWLVAAAAVDWVVICGRCI